MDEGAFRVHKIKFMIKPGPGFGNRGGVGQHANRSLDLGTVTAWDHGWRLVVDADLEARRAPVDELDRLLRLDHGN